MDEVRNILGSAVLRDILIAVQTLVSLALIVIVASRTTKNEGLTGSIGGPSVSNFKGKPGMEEQMSLWTMRLCIAWFAIGALVGIAYAQ